MQSLEATLSYSYRYWKGWFEKRNVADKYFSLWVSLGLSLFCIITTFPSYELFLEPNEIVALNWKALKTQIQHPLTPLPYLPSSHAGQIGMRLLLPAIAHLFHLQVFIYFYLQHFAGVLFFFLLLSLAKRLEVGAWTGFLLTLGIAATYVGKSFFVDTVGYFDGFCYLALLGALLVRPYWAVGLLYFCGFFIDERAFLAVPLVAASRFFLYSDGRSFKIALNEGIIAFVSFLLTFGIRYYIGKEYGIQTGEGSEYLGWVTARDNFKIAGFGLLSGLELISFIGFLPGYYLYKQGWRWAAWAYVLYYAACFLVMLIVLDLTRCTAYLFPGAICGFIILAKRDSKRFTEILVGCFCLSAILFPDTFVVGDYITWMGPIVPKIFRIIAVIGFGLHI